MRRTISVLLYVVGGWILASGLMAAWMNVGQSSGEQLAMTAIFWLFSAPFLLLGMWASPGRRLSELGLTLLICAGVGAAIALLMFLFLNDPSFLRLIPPDQKLPQFKFAPVSGFANVIVAAGLGWLLDSRGREAVGEPRR
jgi:hypothetical protein